MAEEAKDEVNLDEFPRWKHRHGESRLFESLDEWKAAGGKWSDKPIDPDAPESDAHLVAPPPIDKPKAKDDK